MRTNKKIILPIFFFIFSLLLFIPYSTEAASASVYQAYNLSLMSWYSNFNPTYKFSNPSISAVYNAQVRNADTNALISNNASVDVGTRIVFILPGDSSQSLSWGGYGDTSTNNIGGGGSWDSNVSAPSITPG
jgi:hypothetical protein